MAVDIHTGYKIDYMKAGDKTDDIHTGEKTIVVHTGDKTDDIQKEWTA